MRQEGGAKKKKKRVETMTRKNERAQVRQVVNVVVGITIPVQAQISVCSYPAELPKTGPGFLRLTKYKKKKKKKKKKGV